jgi:hypothetical protein
MVAIANVAVHVAATSRFLRAERFSGGNEITRSPGESC